MVASGIVVSASMGSVLIYDTLVFNKESRERLRAIGDIVAADVSAALAFEDTAAIAETLKILEADPTILQLYVLNQKGEIAAWYMRDDKSSRPADLAQRRETLMLETGETNFEFSPEVARPIVRGATTLGTVALELDSKVFVDKLLASGSIGGLILLLSLAGSYLLARRLGSTLTRPIRSLADAMDDVTRTKNYALRVDVGHIDELATLSAGFNSMLTEISNRDRKLLKRQEHLHRLANFDSLTGLPNRVLFNDRLDQALRHTRRTDESLAVLFIDLDDFKPINDTYGHRIGDFVLNEVARRLEKGTRADDTVARLGGDEFTIFMQGVKSVEDALSVARKHLASIRAPIVHGSKQLFISASIGVALSFEDATAETLVKSADTAMYHAKEKGKNHVILFTEKMFSEVSAKLSLQSDLRRALEQKEFVLHYQPRIDMESKRCSGVEALVRWNHPELGLIPPGAFISLAEETGAIIPLGEWVMRQACNQLSDWQRQGIQIPRVSVNVSPKQFLRQNIVELAKSALEDAGLCSHALELEITETALMNDMSQSVAILHKLQRTGIKISIDDFGTGYSSLSSLRVLPVDILKVDRSFVMNSHESEEDAQILSAIIAMAHSLHLGVVAEGVETAGHVALLQRQDCREAQGYYFARPMPAQELPPYLAARNLIPTIGADARPCIADSERSAACGGKGECWNEDFDPASDPQWGYDIEH